VRVVGRTDGRVGFDTVGQQCQQGPAQARLCFLPPPYDLAQKGFAWPFDPKRVRVVGRGTVRGHEVVWLESAFGNPKVNAEVERVALDADTHQPVAQRDEMTRARGPFEPGDVLSESFFTFRKDVPARDVSFVVPNGGADRAFPPGSLSTKAKRASMRQALAALGRPPLWLGRSFEGFQVSSIQVGRDVLRAEDGIVVRPVPFVRFVYGALTLQEFAARPFWYLQGPGRGRVVYDSGRATLSRDGLLVVATSKPEKYRIDRAAATTLAKALRPAR
jgi:hypothetical protein